MPKNYNGLKKEKSTMTANMIYYTSKDLQPEKVEINTQLPTTPHTHMYRLYKQQFIKHIEREG
jgi:hypothetical protein